jgi:hypothetical protein
MALIEPVSPASSPFAPIAPITDCCSEFIIEPISPPTSPSSSGGPVSPNQTNIPEQKSFEFTSEWFDQSSKVWRRGKIFSRKKQFVYYRTNADSPFTMQEYKNKNSGPNKIKNASQPNATLWSQCGYVSSTGNKCTEQGIFYEDEIASNREYDYEIYTTVHFCKKHAKYQKKEEHKRQLHMECIMLERQIKQNKNNSITGI